MCECICNNIISDIASILTIITFIFYLEEIYNKGVKIISYIHKRERNKININNIIM